MTVGLQSVKHVLMNSGISIPKENITDQDNVLTEYILVISYHVIGTKPHTRTHTAEDQDEYTMEDDIHHQQKIFFSASYNIGQKFHITSVKPFQRNRICADLEGQDTLVVHPTGSGKSLCFQFPSVDENKKAVVITPTISLMKNEIRK